VIIEALRALGATVGPAEVFADSPEALTSRLRVLAGQGTGLVITSGGTGLGPRDTTPEAIATVATRRVPGLAELIRTESRHHTDMAWLSRAEAALVDSTLVIALPGSPRAAAQGIAILGPLLAHARTMIEGGSHA
jgi:cyclic pyranopterin phosphate synthase